jgi:EAL domain-containing protein (putative c-di-GMP-specific phosphodiesterase class I)
MNEDYKKARDRFLAFALAGADLLIETDQKLMITDLIGASKSILGDNPKTWFGRSLWEAFCLTDKAVVRRLGDRITQLGRLPSLCLTLDGFDHNDPSHKTIFRKKVDLGGTIMPSIPDRIFFSLKVQNTNLAEDAQRDEVTGLLDFEGFKALTQSSLTSEDGQSPSEMKLVRLKGLSETLDVLSEGDTKVLMGEIGAVLRSNAAGGAAAGQLSEDSFSILPDEKSGGVDDERLAQELKAVASAIGLNSDLFVPEIGNLDLKTANLDEGDLARALSFVLNDFCRTGSSPVSTLQDGFKQALALTVQSLDNLKQMIEQQRFTLFYQPVIKLKGRAVHHYEALLRFKDGRNPFDTIRLSEQLGLAQELDLAILKMALDTMQERMDLRVAVNMSGSSVQSESFRHRMMALIGKEHGLNQRLMFELTESSAIDDMDGAAKFLETLRKKGFEVALDDFGAGASAYSYLRRFDIDYVKIDGQFLGEARHNKRQRALIQSICHLCKSLDTEVIAEMIEDEATAVMCISMGMEFGQGYLFGKPEPEHTIALPTSGSARRASGLVG